MSESILLISPDRYVLRACEKFGVLPVVITGAMHRDSGQQDLPESAVEIFCEDHRRPEAILTALHRAGFGEHRFDAVQTTNEFVLITAAVLGKALGTRAIDPGTAVAFKDKSLQKSRLRAVGIRVARTEVIDDIFAVDGSFRYDFDRAVLKPVAGAGTEVTSVVDGLAQLLSVAADYRRRRIPNRTFVLEEFVSGDEWTADGVVTNGEITFYGLGCYDEPCLTTLDSARALRMRKFDPDTEAWTYKAADQIVRTAIATLGLTDGVFHMELFHDPATGEITFSECAARRGGALTAEEILAKFNVDLGEAALLSALGHDPELNVRVRAEAVGSVYLPSRAGTLIDCPTPAQLMELPGVEFARIETPVGASMDKASSTTGRIGMVMMTAPDPVSLELRRMETLQWFDDRLVVAPVHTTLADLRSWHRTLSTPYEFADVCYHP